MELVLNRKKDNHEETFGHLHIDGQFFCVTLEDTYRHKKIKGETRIPAGYYEIKLRKQSPMAERYKAKYKTDGMLHLQKVPNFTNVYIHIGNSKEDTNGCILVGAKGLQIVEEGRQKLKIVDSTKTYKPLWKLVADKIEINEPVHIKIIDN